MISHDRIQKAISSAERLRDRVRALWRQCGTTPVTREHLRSLDVDTQRFVEQLKLLEQQEVQHGGTQAGQTTG